jgi:hypothetical protein
MSAPRERQCRLIARVHALEADMQVGKSGAATWVCAWLLLVLSSSAAERAHAEELGTRQNLVLSAERMFGFYIDNQTIEDAAGRDDTTHRTVFGLGWVGSQNVLPLATPRLGIDYFITNGFTLGGNIGFFTHTNEGTTLTGFLLAVRAGYALRLGHSVSLWPRAGLGFTLFDLENTKDDQHLFSMTLEAPFAFALTEGFAITAGPTLDFGFAGDAFGRSYRELLFGVMIGLSGWINL